MNTEAHANLPSLSIILATNMNYDALRKTMSYVRAQTIRAQIEIIFLMPSAADFGLTPADMEGFHSVQQIEVPDIHSGGQVRALGVKAAHASILSILEDHAYPLPQWAEALLKAYDDYPSRVAVGAAVLNPNPATMVSWADFLMGYGPWMSPVASGVIDMLPGHNGSFRRAALLDLGDALADLIEIENAAQRHLRERGGTLYLEANALFYHLNFSEINAWLPALYFSGQLYAAERARGWGVVQKLLYIGGGVLIPLVRLPRIYFDVRDPVQRRALFPKILPALLLSLYTSALGEIVGYAFGIGRSQQALVRYEFNRVRAVRPSDIDPLAQKGG